MAHPILVRIGRAAVFASVVALASGGCGSLQHTTYVRPALTIPADWESPAAMAVDESHPPTQRQVLASSQPSPWWHAFNDPQLDRIVERVLNGNRDLATAVINIRRAQQQIALSRADALPQLAAAATAGYQHMYRNGLPTTQSGGITASVAYQVDLWGTLSSQTRAAQWEAHATEMDRDALLLTIVGDAVDLYWQMAYLTDQLDQNQAAIDYARQTMTLSRASFSAGAIAHVDEMASEQTLAIYRAQRATLKDQQSQTDHAMSLLLGEPPGEHFVVRAERLAQPLPTVHAGIPADLLARRPDVRAAELRVREALAQSDATRTSFYPTLSLTGAGGTSSDALRNILQNPVASIAASLAAPFLNVPTMKASVAISQAAYDTDVVLFQQSFYTALQDVANALAARADYAAQESQYDADLKLAWQRENRYRYAYESGATQLQTLLDAQQNRRDVELALSSVRYAAHAAQVSLYLGLGGFY